MTSKPIFIQLTSVASGEREIIYLNISMIVMIDNKRDYKTGATIVPYIDGAGGGLLYVRETPQQIMELIKNA